LPALNRARASANTVKCASNLKQIGTALQMYANDWKGYIVPAQYTDDTFTATQSTWTMTLMEGKYFPQQALPGQFNPQARSVMLCPDGREDRWNGSTPSSQADQQGAAFWGANVFGFGPGATTYAVNGTISDATSPTRGVANFPFNAIPSQYNAAPAGLFRRLHKFTDFKQSASMVMVYDGVYLHNTAPNRINARHNKYTVTNVLFADGHVVPLPTKTLPQFGSRSATSNDFYDLPAIRKTTEGGRWRLDQ
jgi:prepilin-type processing-associated H-X9-DG protein